MMRTLARCKAILVISAALSSCKPLISGSYLKNIYDMDTQKSRRHEASLIEANWTVHLKGCSGILLSPSLVLSAHHCSVKVGANMQSGWSALSNGGADLIATEILEDNADLDYMITAVRWLDRIPSSQIFPPFIATDPGEIFSSQVSDQGDRIFTVGFPDDRAGLWRSTYSEGQIKNLKGPKMFFNIGVINGNSGGAILKAENNMLVGITIGGTKGYKEVGWNDGSADDAENWNYGTATWAIYPASAVLQRQFPNGRNIYFGDSYFPRTKIYLSIKSENQGPTLKAAANHETASLYVCPATIFPCTPATAGAEALSFETALSGRRFYSLNRPLATDEMQKLGFVAFDKDGRRIGDRHIAVETAHD